MNVRYISCFDGMMPDDEMSVCRFHWSIEEPCFTCWRRGKCSWLSETLAASAWRTQQYVMPVEDLMLRKSLHFSVFYYRRGMNSCIKRSAYGSVCFLMFYHGCLWQCCWIWNLISHLLVGLFFCRIVYAGWLEILSALIWVRKHLMFF